ncbi:MAG TPA: TonB family protein [Rhizomicrobium sp.]|jgi:TonB family protein|nr:TonB family protein [Rhizomicrobium sp.]
MHRLAFTIALSPFLAAFAQDAAPPAHATVLHPTPAGAPHVCPPDIYYPASSIANHEEGVTGLNFHVAVDGTVKSITIGKSSGSDALDAAAIQCASGWRYTPAMQNGQPVDVPWKVSIRWALADPVQPVSPAIGPVATAAPGAVPPSNGTFPPHFCPHSGDDDTIGLHEQGAVGLSFTIAADGTVRNIAVADSSGLDVLDKAAAACARGWRYMPATLHGHAIAYPWKVTVTWSVAMEGKDGNYRARASSGNSGCTEHPAEPGGGTNPTVAIVRFTVDTDGGVSDAALLQSSGDKVYDDYAVTCVSGWHFRPARRNNVPVKSSQLTRIAWNRVQ